MHYCPSCGHNLTADQPVITGGWHLTPTQVQLRGNVVKLSAAQASILYTIAAANGRPVSRHVLLGRTSESENENLVSVQITRIRSTLGDNCPIETVWGRGYRWNEAA